MTARSPDPGTAASLSAFAQSGGYLIASAGPLELGLLHTATGSWAFPVALLLALAAIGLAVGVLAARPLVLPVGQVGAGREVAPAQIRHTRRLPGHTPRAISGLRP